MGLTDQKNDTANFHIKPVTEADLPACLNVIRKSFATVAQEFGLTEQNCPGHTSFLKMEKLQSVFSSGAIMAGYYKESRLVGYVSLTKKDESIYELHSISVLPDYRHFGIGRELLDYCKETVKRLNGNKICIGIIEESARLKDWYSAYGFIHTGTRKFDHLPFVVGFMELEI